MASLRARIALLYGGAFVLVILLAALAIDFGFRQILLNQAQLRMERASDLIVQTLETERTINVFEPESPSAELTRPENVDHWAGPFTYLQIDTSGGYPEAKSSNMGSIELIPPKTFDRSDQRIDFTRSSDGHNLIVFDRLLRVDGQAVAIAQFAEPLDNVRAVLAQARTILLISALGGALLIGAAAYFIAGTAIDPIKQLTTAMTEIGSDQLDRRIATHRTDEVGRLAAAFNAMLARLEEAFARERQFIADASHELKTPLTVINANAQLLKRWGNDEPTVRGESLDAIIAESQQLAGMVSGMLTLAKADSGDQIPKKPLLIGRLTSEVVAHARGRAESKALALWAHLPQPDAVVIGDESLLRQLINNLIDNAIKFTEQGQIDVSVASTADSVRIDVADTGIGISVETADRLFDRFFRSDVSHTRIIEGTGLGLAIVRSIARIHGGTVAAMPRPSGGSLFRVILPAANTSVIET